MKKNCLMIGTLVFILISLSACFPSGPRQQNVLPTNGNAQTQQHTANEGDPAPQNSASTDVHEPAASYPPFMEKDLSELVKVNANVAYPSSGAYSTFAAKLAQKSSADIKDMFIKGKSIATQLEEGSVAYSDCMSYYYETSDGDTLRIDADTLEYYSKKYECLYRVGFKASDLSELQGFSKNDAIIEAKNLLSELGFAYAEEPSIIAFDEKTLNDMENQYAQNFSDLGKAYSKKPFATDDECYLLLFRYSMKDTLVYDKLYYPRAAQPLEVKGCYAEVALSKRGVVFVNIYSPYSFGGEESAASAIINCDQALEIINSQFESIILSSPVVIEDISFVWFPKQKKEGMNDFSMIPSWVIQTERTEKSSGDKNSNEFVKVETFVINALDGSFLLREEKLK